MKLQVGETYQVNHTRKGTFTATLKSADDTWATLEVKTGKAKAMCRYNVAEAVASPVSEANKVERRVRFH